MSYYPKEGLITLHQAQNPPITQQITEELNKTGYGEFITETELNEIISNLPNQLTNDEKAKITELLPYKIGDSDFYPDTPKYVPFLVTVKTDLSCEVGKSLDFRHTEYPPVDYRARITCTGDNSLTFPNITADVFRTPSTFTTSTASTRWKCSN